MREVIKKELLGIMRRCVEVISGEYDEIERGLEQSAIDIDTEVYYYGLELRAAARGKNITSIRDFKRAKRKRS